MKFCWSTLRVKDMEESLRFYRDIVGLALNARFQAGPGVEIAFLGEGETKIELICDKAQADIDAGRDISWGFEVPSLDAFMEFLRGKGIQIAGGPFQPNPNTRFFYALDPNGMKIQFVERNA